MIEATDRRIDMGAVEESPLTRAVLYLRVSTKEQAERDGDPEGYSIPAQREACKRKAAGLGALVDEQFVDRGESAKTADRPELQRMLAYVKQNQIDYVIVHKVDRLARNRADDVQITLALQAAGATLVSCTESIDETPSGILLHGVVAAVAEFYSRNLANEVMKGLVQKAKNGGTPGKAPIGYRNVRKFDEGREIRSVEIDPVRAPLVSWAFEAYASGEWTQRQLLHELRRQGLDVPPTRTKPATQLSLSYIQHMLTNPYYKGTVRYRGVEYDGKHDKLVSPELWQKVQDVLRSRNEIRQKEREHPHYLKGLLCGHCNSRMIVTHAKSRSGRIYPYFVCIGRHQKRNNCTMSAVLIDKVEELVEEHYATIQLPAELRETIEKNLRTELEAHYAEARKKHARLEKQRARLLDERRKLLQAHYAEAVPLELLRQEQQRIAAALAKIGEQEAATEDEQKLVAANLKRALNLASDCRAAYVSAPPHIRKLFNQAFFRKLWIDDSEHIRSELASPFDILLHPGVKAAAAEASARPEAASRFDWSAFEASWNANDPEDEILEVAGLKERVLVGRAGLEPATLGLKVPCSTS
jgi:site-specific DNA recombinase